MKRESLIHGKQDGNLASLKNAIWPSSAIFFNKRNQYQFDYNNRIRTRINPKFEINNNIQEDPLKLCKLENRIGIGRLYDEKFKRIFNSRDLEKFPPKTERVFKGNLTKKRNSHDTIYLYENQTSKCVINESE